MVLCSAYTSRLWAQAVTGAPMTLNNAPQRDSSNKTNTADWQDEKARIYFQTLNTSQKRHPDTLLHYFHRRPFSLPWYINTGNFGSPSVSLLFTPDFRTGPTLGYHSFDVYRFQVDSLHYYNTTRPYSEFVYQLGSKAEQQASILHTQNIKPNWNVAVQYRKINAPGYYKIQRTNNDNSFLTTHYTSRNNHYELYGAVVYNKEQNDENGGILSDSLLNLPDYSNRSVIPVFFQSNTYGTRRSPVSNMLRDVGVMLQHSYTFGKSDTTYNEDSTQYSAVLTPRFRITHRFDFVSERYQYKDQRPDSMKYTGFFEQGFNTATDSVFMQQNWSKIDNAFMLSGFLGKRDKAISFQAGWGIRADQFNTQFVWGKSSNNFASNYLTGSIRKEALQEKQWGFNLVAKLYFSGQTAGNFLVDAQVDKTLSPAIGHVRLGFRQELNSAPYNYQLYQNQYFTTGRNYDKESITKLFAEWTHPAWKLQAGVRNYLIANYIYLNAAQQFSQHASAFNLTQVWLQKRFQWRIFYLDNEWVYQQKTAQAPVNVPVLMGRHQLAIETRVFKKALLLTTGIDVRYHSRYAPSGYAPFLNRYYYQDTQTISNPPSCSVFFNFKVKKFRAYIMLDQLQQLAYRNIIFAPNYPAQNLMLRFGFNWVMIN